MGIVAVTLALGMSILSTAPGDSPGTPALGTATKAVTLSVQTKRLSLDPPKLTAELTDCCALLMIASLPSAGLTTSVRSRFGLTAIIPASLRLPLSDEREMEKKEITSLVASRMSIAGEPPPKLFAWSGLETNTR
jgi:hypothetical protein